jgi:hypothetical protein
LGFLDFEFVSGAVSEFILVLVIYPKSIKKSGTSTKIKRAKSRRNKNKDEYHPSIFVSEVLRGSQEVSHQVSQCAA